MSEKEYAVYYERVSTEHESQDESLANQRKLKESFLSRHKNIICLEDFSERNSGKSDLRSEYQRMINYIEQNEDKKRISYIMVKDTKRLCRSSEVAQAFKRWAAVHKIKLILLSTSTIYEITSKEQRLMYGFESLINEDYVFKMSEYGRIAFMQKCEAKKLTKNNITFGFRWDDGIVIDDTEADVIRGLYEIYCFKGATTKELKEYMSVKGYPRSAATIHKYLQDTSYIGIFNMNKKNSELGVGVGAKTKRFNTKPEEWVRVERPELAIISGEIFELALKIRKSRQSMYKTSCKGISQSRFTGNQLFAGKILCGYCKYTYLHGYADRKRTIGIYKESYNTKANDMSRTCQNPYKRVFEQDIVTITKLSVKMLLDIKKQQQEKSKGQLLKAIEKALLKDDSTELKIKELERKKANLIKEQKRIRLAILNSSGTLKVDFENDYEENNDKINTIDAELEQLEKSKNKMDDIQVKLQKISSAIDRFSNAGLVSVSREFVTRFINKIVIGPEHKLALYFNGSTSFDSGKAYSQNVDAKCFDDKLPDVSNLNIDMTLSLDESEMYIMKMFSYDVDFSDKDKSRIITPRNFNVNVCIAV